MGTSYPQTAAGLPWTDSTLLGHLGKVEQVGSGLETQASFHERLQSSTLTAERVNGGDSRLGQGRLEEVRQQAEDRVESVEFLGLVLAVGDTGQELGNERQVDDERGSKKRVLASVVDRQRVATSHEDLGGVITAFAPSQGTTSVHQHNRTDTTDHSLESLLVVSSSWHVADLDNVVRVLDRVSLDKTVLAVSRLASESRVEQAVGLDLSGRKASAGLAKTVRRNSEAGIQT